ncbi:MAG TPA: D-alanyl-D-alanine carboxypeptidase family protein [Clostridia bacterium]|nr:D-alanyl-D-alanine carboxypeptidase family protein [Clostridia bacterium]
MNKNQKSKEILKRAVAVIMSLMMLFSCLSIFAIAKNEQGKPADMPVEVRAKAAILMDASTGKVLMKMNEHEKLFPASVTKIMTLLLVAEAIDAEKISLSDKVTTSANSASKGGSQIWLKEGEIMTVDELLKATAIYSANDACNALGEHISGSEEAFIALCNERAKELGMKDTHFDNCTGLDDTTDTHLTSAYDIALMSRELVKHEIILNYTTIWMDSLRGGDTELVNTNKLVRFYQGATGLKTGTTSKAGCCLAATALRDGTHLVAVVMGSSNSDDRFNGAKAMLNWGFSNYETITPEIDKSLITKVNVIKGVEEKITPALPDILPILILRGRKDDLEQTINMAVDVKAPVEKGQKLGSVEFSLDGEIVGEYVLTAPNSIAKLTFGVVLRRMLASLCG